jgi:hypothetical protein
MLAFMLRRALLLLCAVLGSNFVTAAEIAVPGDYPTLQDAIDAAEQDDVVLIEPGTYEENLILRGDIELRGRETARTLLMPSDAGPILTIQGVSGVTVTNLTLVDATTGLLVTNVADLVIRNLVFEGASDAAIDIDASVDVAIEHCVFYGNATAIRRLAVDSIIENNLFAANAVTIASPLGAPVTNVRSNGFFDNDDLKQGDVDTGLGTDFQVGDPRFVDVDAHDYHVRAGSPAIDTGTGDDVIDDTVADLGVYGGEEADPTPFPVSGLTLDDASATNPPPFALEVSWDANLDYRITSDSMPGRYRVYYQQNQAGPPYDGDDGANGTEPSPVDVGLATSYRLEQLMPEVGAPPVPMLTAAEPRSESIVLEWNDVAGASGYRVFWGTASTAENSLDLGDVTRTTITGLVNGTVYRFAVAALRRPVYHVAADDFPGNCVSNNLGQGAVRFARPDPIEIFAVNRVGVLGMAAQGDHVGGQDHIHLAGKFVRVQRLPKANHAIVGGVLGGMDRPQHGQGWPGIFALDDTDRNEGLKIVVDIFHRKFNKGFTSHKSYSPEFIFGSGGCLSSWQQF